MSSSSTPAPPGLEIVTTNPELEALFLDHTDKLIVVDFYATWCGPCKMILPKFLKMANNKKFRGKVVFVKVDVDDAPEIAEKHEVEAMPTFHLFREGKVVNKMVGANDARLLTMITEHM